MAESSLCGLWLGEDEDWWHLQNKHTLHPSVCEHILTLDPREAFKGRGGHPKDQPGWYRFAVVTLQEARDAGTRLIDTLRAPSHGRPCRLQNQS